MKQSREGLSAVGEIHERQYLGTVLVVEDEVLIRLYIADELRASGFDVIEAGSGEEAGGCALVQAKVSNTNGQLVDGMPVQFTTTLCCFAVPDEVNIVGTTVVTTRGTATVTYCGKRERGTATITAAAEDAFDTVLISVF